MPRKNWGGESLFGISYRYRHIIKKPEIDFFDGRFINLHISLLPYNRGADPNLWSFLENTPKGVTIHQIAEGLDTGDILLQKPVEFGSKVETLSSSYNKLIYEIETLFIENLHDILLSKIKPLKQNGIGSLHRMKDKQPYLKYLINGWDTLCCDIEGLANC